MKKSIYIVLIGLLFGLGAVSCDNTSEDVFDQPASERLTKSINEYKATLASAEQGWLLEYFPDKKQSYGGYNYSVKFGENQNVEVWSELYKGGTASETSMYDVFAYGGSVLSFNTYNKALMDEFSKPSPSEYNAKGGDYEFLIMSKNADTIHLRGIKTTNHMRLIKLSEPFSAYLEKSKMVQDFLKSASLGTTIENKDVSILLSGRNLTFEYKDGEKGKEKLESKKIAFIYTDKGIRLYKPIEIGKVIAQEFILDKEAKVLNDVNGKMQIGIAFAPIDLTQARWILNTSAAEDASKAVKEAFNNAKQANAAKYGEMLYPGLFMGLSYKSKTLGDFIGISMYSITPDNKNYRAHYDLAFGGVINKPSQLTITSIAPSTNWRWYTHLLPVVNVLTENSPYNIELDNAENPTEVKCTSVNNPEVYFILRK